MDATQLVDLLLADTELVAWLAADRTGHPAIYQIVAPEAELFPRIAVFESAREYTRFVDDLPLEERTEFRLDIYARDNVLFDITTRLLCALTVRGFSRFSTLQDDYLPELELFVKSVSFEYFDELPVPGMNC